MKHLHIGLLLASATFALPLHNVTAAPQSAVASTPRLNERGELTITLMNWSKLEMQVSSITATLGITKDDLCKWNLAKPVSVAATQEETIVIAGADKVSTCLRTKKLDGPFYSLQFSAITPDLEKTELPTDDTVLTIDAEVTHRDRMMKSASSWSLTNSAR
jgi:hypothetical protein